MQSAESCYTSTREGKVFGADGCIPSELLFAASSWENKGKCKDIQGWNGTIEIICTVVIGVRGRVSVRRKERWQLPTG